MKTKQLVTHLAAAAFCCALGSSALSAATTTPVGAVSVTVPSGTTILSMPFQKAIAFQATVDSISGSDVSFASTLPTLDGPHYLQVLDGSEEGKVYTVDSYAGSTATLVSAPASLAAGDSVAIRAHVTIADLGTVPNGTSVTLLNPGTTPTVASYIFGGWDVSDQTVIYPGEGFVINSGSSFDVTMVGTVAVDDVVFEAAVGTSVVGSLDPIDGSADVLSDVAGSAPNGASITELVNGNPVIYNNLFGSWSQDPSNIDVADFKTFVLNTGSAVDIVNSGIQVN